MKGGAPERGEERAWKGQDTVTTPPQHTVQERPAPPLPSAQAQLTHQLCACARYYYLSAHTSCVHARVIITYQHTPAVCMCALLLLISTHQLCVLLLPISTHQLCACVIITYQHTPAVCMHVIITYQHTPAVCVIITYQHTPAVCVIITYQHTPAVCMCVLLLLISTHRLCACVLLLLVSTHRLCACPCY